MPSSLPPALPVALRALWGDGGAGVPTAAPLAAHASHFDFNNISEGRIITTDTKAQHSSSSSSTASSSAFSFAVLDHLGKVHAYSTGSALPFQVNLT